MAIQLAQAGYDDVVLLEKSGGVGGTWFHNRYPGCACDIRSHLYSFSFEPKHDWSKPYAPQPEILAYMEHVATKYDVLPKCRFGAAVVRADWDDSRAVWTLTLESGETYEADVVVSAIGMFNDIAWPDIEGIASFGGASWHSARWNWDHDISGERVGVVGSAASAVQFVPEIVKDAKQVHLFQRSANWVVPKLDDPYTPEQIEAFRANPEALRASREETFEQVDAGCTFSDPDRLAEFESYGKMMRDQVQDPVVREKLKPLHPFGCKRPLLSNEFYAAFNRPNLELVTDGIARITESGIETVDGKHRACDTIVYATGFAATKYLSAIDVRGRDGRSIEDAWSEGSHAYLGITTSGFPNLFMMYGPNTNNGSILTMLEAQSEYIVRHVQRLDDEGLSWMDVRPEPESDYNDDIQEKIARVKVWNFGCTSYYRTPAGRIVTQWPDSMSGYEERTSAPDDDAFEVAKR